MESIFKKARLFGILGAFFILISDASRILNIEVVGKNADLIGWGISFISFMFFYFTVLNLQKISNQTIFDIYKKFYCVGFITIVLTAIFIFTNFLSDNYQCQQYFNRVK